MSREFFKNILNQIYLLRCYFSFWHFLLSSLKPCKSNNKSSYISVSFLCVFLLSYPENIMPDAEGYEPKTMTIGTNNVFEVGCGTLGFFFFFNYIVLKH